MILYDKKKIQYGNLIFDSKALRRLLIPLMIEQLLNTFMGMADTVMVSRVGSAAISAVSLVDSVNVLFIQVFSALAAGATILCSFYIGRNDNRRAARAAEQVNQSLLVIAFVIMILCLVFNRPLLSLVFGQVEPDVMASSRVYFYITAVFYPFLALSNSGSAFYRAGGESAFPMRISVLCNLMNIVGNAVLIFGLGWGVAGAALATLFSRAANGLILTLFLRRDRQPIVLRRYLVRPDWPTIGNVLAIGIPSGIENGMFQFGKLAIQSSISTLGTVAIAAQAMTILLESLNGVAGIGIGIGLMTVVGQCMGAGRKEEAKYNIVKLTALSEVVVTICCVLVYALTGPITSLAGMEPRAAQMCRDMMLFVTLMKPLVWVLSFIPAYGLRAAGDVKFSMLVSTVTMWTVRVLTAIVLIRVFHVGAIACWIGMAADWTVRAFIFSWRYLSMRWTKQEIVKETGGISLKS